MFNILIVDDEPDVVSLIKDYFEINGYGTLTANSGEKAMELALKQPDLILLDINMPHMDGLAVCRRIRDYVSCPILFLTARVEDGDKIQGFAAGGDDYIQKPFSMEELGARVAAHIRREHRCKADANVRFWGRMVIDYTARTVAVEGPVIPFAKKEYEIIELLSLHPGQVFDKERIYEKLWGYDAEGDSSVLKEHIRKIRAKLMQASGNEYIETVWGMGYRWKK